MNNKQAKKLRKAAMAVGFVQKNANPKVVYTEFKEIHGKLNKNEKAKK